jgi:hypothetical protein
MDAKWTNEDLEDVKAQLLLDYALACRQDKVVAIQVVSANQQREGFFISHWFNMRGIRALLENIFPAGDYEVDHETFPKGMLFAIKQRGSQPTGVVTMLNNVLGNILPSEQALTLSRIRAIL